MYMNLLRHIGSQLLKLVSKMVYKIVFEIVPDTDYGRPMKPFLSKYIPNIWVWAANLGNKFWGILGIFGQIISTSAPIQVL